MVTASQYPAKVCIALQLLRRDKGPWIVRFKHSLSYYLLLCAMMTVLHKKGRYKKQKWKFMSLLQFIINPTSLRPKSSNLISPILRLGNNPSLPLRMTNIIAEGHSLINFSPKCSPPPVFLLKIWIDIKRLRQVDPSYS